MNAIVNSPCRNPQLAIRRLSRLQRLILEEIGATATGKRGTGKRDNPFDDMPAAVVDDLFGPTSLSNEEIAENGRRYERKQQLDWVRLARITRRAFGRHTAAPGRRRDRHLCWDDSGAAPPTPAFRASFSRAMKGLEQAGIVERIRPYHGAMVRPTLAYTLLVARRGLVLGGNYKRPDWIVDETIGLVTA